MNVQEEFMAGKSGILMFGPRKAFSKPIIRLFVSSTRTGVGQTGQVDLDRCSRAGK